MSMLADTVDLLVGVDTHRDTHTAAICGPGGGLLRALTVSTDPDGLGEILQALGEVLTELTLEDTPRIVWAIEGAGSYGAGLRDALHDLDQRVVEITRAKRARGRGKNDVNDATAIARTALARERDGEPRRGNVREALRLITAARATHVAHRTRLLNQFHAYLITAPAPARARLQGLSTPAKLTTAARLRPTPVQLPAADTAAAQALALASAYTVLRETARQIAALDDLIAGHDRELHRITTAHAAPLLDQIGVGPVTAAAILLAHSHPGRIHSEAAFAALAGASPLEASSGRTVRHRLNRTGDRRLNAALHRIVITRRRMHPPTQAYITRRTTQGKTDPEINRCLKRYLARSLHHLCETLPAMP